MKLWHQIGLNNCPDQAWANQAGLTKELLAWPHQDDWLIRVSVATIRASGPYSRLPEIRRWHTILAGELTLHIDGQKIALDSQSDPLFFDGAQTCDCILAQDCAQAFNIMTRGDCHAQVRRLGPQQQWSDPIGQQNLLLGGLYTATEVELNRLAPDGTQRILSLQANHWFWSDEPQQISTLRNLTVREGQIIAVLLHRDTV